MSAQSDLRETIAAVRADDRQRVIRCPAHDDRRASLSIGRGIDDRILLRCHAGCLTEAILAAAGLTWPDVMPEVSRDEASQIVATYDYTDERGTMLYQVVRYMPKTFRQRRPDGAGGWTWRLGDVRRVMFGLAELQHQKIAYVVEGEKDVLRLRTVGIVATTNAGGAGTWRDEYTQQLLAADVEFVVVVPDNDDAGQRHAQSVARSCHAAGLKVKIVMLPGLPAKGDVCDWLDSGHTRDELVAIANVTGGYEPRTQTAHNHHVDQETVAVRPIIVTLADVQPEAVTWLWPGRVAAGKLALLVGDPGLGKSWITLDIAARVSAGHSWPDGTAGNPPADVLLLSAEDGLADTIRPRLDALRADVGRVHHLAVLRAGEHERAVQLSDVTALERAIEETGARVVIIDPISAYLGSTDSHRDSEVRGLMAPLAALAERTGVAILGVMHLAKSTQRPAIYRAVGSIAFAAAARVVLAVAADPDRDDRRILAPIKSNLSTPPAALAYALTEDRLVWEPHPVTDLDVNALLSGPTTDRTELREAEDWLRDVLAGGPLPSREIQKQSEQAGIARRTLHRAKQKLGIEADRIGFGSQGTWYWHLPPSISATKSATDSDVAPNDERVDKMADVATSTSKNATSSALAFNDEENDVVGDII